MKQTLLVAAIVFSTVSVAHAGGLPGSIGVGTEIQLSGVGGLSANYDTGKFHVGGFIGIADPEGPENTRLDIGGRFFYHVASTAMSDFSVGGSIGIRSDDAGPTVDRTLEVFIEPGFQIRAFIASNVALSFTGGLSIGASDASGIALDGQVNGVAGIHYYF
ncbi:MAG: hypothetical protein ABIY55_36240 [Kofleriaceae bacterium]